jgi:hypothetical protein
MAPRYDLSADLVGADGLQSTSPVWVVAFARYANSVTWDPSQRTAASVDPSFARDEKPSVLVTTECIGAQVNVSKGNYRHQMSLDFLESGTVKWLNEVFPGDWVMANVAYNEDDATRLVAKFTNRERVNGWNDGLKFVGRVKAIQKTVVINRDGTPQSRYRVQCEGFSEFDSTVMYYPQRTFTQSAPDSLQQFGILVSNVIRGKYGVDQGAIDINLIIPAAMRAIFGQGAWAHQTFRGDAVSPNQAYFVPRSIFAWLGQNGTTFADLIRLLLGVQKYGGPGNASNLTVDNPGLLFWPDNSDLNDGTFGNKRLIGSFPQAVVPQTTNSVWGFLTTYLNPPINEPLVTLRPDKDGYVYPFFTIRQTPFTSERGLSYEENLDTFVVNDPTDEFGEALAANAGESDFRVLKDTFKPLAPGGGVLLPTSTRTKDAFQRLMTTRFLELPRWVVPTSLLRTATIGRTDDNRFNLVFVYGSGPGVMFDNNMQFVLAGPITDKLDIARNGIRPYMPSLNTFTRTANAFTDDFRDIMADIVMGLHLTLNGSLTLSGIRSPIAPGDNVEFEGVVYHIEAVTHSYIYEPSTGQRDFSTSLTVSRGIKDAVGVTKRAERFANTQVTDPEGSTIAVNKD